MDLLKLFLVTTLVLFPFGELLRIPLGNNIQLNIIDIPIALTGIVWLIRKSSPPKLSQLAPFILFVLVAMVSLLFNLSWLKKPEVIISALYLIRWIAYALIYFAVAGCDKKLKLLLNRLLIISGGIIVALGYLQVFFFSNLKPIYHLGWDEHLYRMVTSFLDPNFAGAFFVLYCLLLAREINKKATSGSYTNFVANKLIPYYLLFIITLIAIFLTYSRSAITMLIASSVIYLFLIKRKKLIIFIFAIVFIAFMVTLPFFNTENFNLLRVNSIKARLISLTEALQIIQKNPITGIGFNTYRYAQLRYGLRDTHSPIPSNADAGTDNSFLFILATTGIFGFLAYMNIWKVMLSGSSYNHNSDPTIRNVFLASIIGLFVNCLFINSLFYPPIMLWMWILAGLNHSK